MSRNDNLKEFDDLIDELQRSDQRPSAPHAFKNELRRNLLNQYEERTLSAQANWNLWRFAGSVAGVLLLVTTIIGFWQAMSQASTAARTESIEEAVLHTITPDRSSLPLELPRDLGDNMRLVGFSFAQSSNLSSQSEQLLKVNLSWETTGQPTADYTAFMHLLDANGNLVAQADQSLGETSTFANGARVDASFDLLLPDTPGTYLFTTGLYDSNTGQQLLKHSTSQGLSLALFEIPANRSLTQLPAKLGDSFRLLDFSLSTHQFTPGEPLQVSLSWETTGMPTADYTAFVHLVDQSGNLLAQADQSLGASSTFVKGTRPNTNLTLWLPDDLPSGAFSIVTGLYDGATGQQLPSDRPGIYLAQVEVTADTAVTENTTNFVPAAVVSGTDDNGLTLRSAPDGQEIGILEEDSVVLLNDEPLQETDGLLWQSVSTTMGKGWVVAEFLTYPRNYEPVDSQPVETSPTPPKGMGSVYLESVVQKERHTAVVTFQVIVEQPILDANLQLFLVNPDWDFDRTNIQSFQLFLPRTDDEGLFVTATPAQILEATGTDHPIVAAILEPLDSSNGTNIVQKFPEFPFDLTSREEIRYTPVNDKSNRNYLEIVDLTPPVGSVLNGVTTFTVTVQYNLTSLETADLITSLLPASAGPAIVGNDVQTITKGEGELTFSFNFEPLETNTASDWILDIKMVDPGEEFPQPALASASPHDNFPDDVYHFEP